jgi:S-adenosylmethionine/arginine decarboxylase-like enzyme
MTELTSWGYHLALDVTGCGHEEISSGENIKNFAKELVKRIDMIAYGEPQAVRFGSGNKFGYTLIQLIETSNIAGHFCEDTDTCYIDVFSCKEFDISVVKETIKEFFKATSMKTHYFERQA